MLKEMVRKIFREILADEYPYLRTPAIALARVASVSQDGDNTVSDLVIHNEESGTSFQAHITGHWYTYRLEVLDRFGNTDEDFPALPDISSRKQFQAGAIVAVAFPYGDLVPAIIGEVEL